VWRTGEMTPSAVDMARSRCAGWNAPRVALSAADDVRSGGIGSDVCADGDPPDHSGLHAARPGDSEAAGLLALMLLIYARTAPDGPAGKGPVIA
jgi:hypothetical protein